MNRIEKIYDHGLRILEEDGILLKHEKVLDMVRKNGARIRGQRAYFTSDQVKYWVEQAPSSFTLHAANPDFNTIIGGEQCCVVPGCDYPSVYEMGTTRDATLQDYVRLAKLVHQCNHFSVNGGILVQPADIPPDLSHLIMLYAAFRTSDKCLIGLPCNEHRMEEIMAMASIVFGGREDLEKTPGILTLIPDTSPLIPDRLTLGSILVCAKYNQPLAVASGPGAVATANALAITTIAQMARPGLAVISDLHYPSGGLTVHSAGAMNRVAAISYEKWIMDVTDTPDSKSWNNRRLPSSSGQYNDNMGPGMAFDLYYRNINTRLRQMLIEYRPPDHNPEILGCLERFMVGKGVSYDIVNKVDAFVSSNDKARTIN